MGVRPGCPPRRWEEGGVAGRRLGAEVSVDGGLEELVEFWFRRRCNSRFRAKPIHDKNQRRGEWSGPDLLLENLRNGFIARILAPGIVPDREHRMTLARRQRRR